MAEDVGMTAAAGKDMALHTKQANGKVDGHP